MNPSEESSQPSGSSRTSSTETGARAATISSLLGRTDLHRRTMRNDERNTQKTETHKSESPTEGPPFGVTSELKGHGNSEYHPGCDGLNELVSIRRVNNPT
jgi:hypothetical protein